MKETQNGQHISPLVSDPPAGKKKIINLYFDINTGEAEWEGEL